MILSVWLDRIRRRFVKTGICLTIAGSVMLYCSVSAGQPLRASLNAIKGTVKVLDRHGEPIEDRSNVVVFIDGIVSNSSTRALDRPLTMSHRERKFAPRVAPIVKGGAIDFFNDDRIYHNVFSLSKSNTFDLGIYAQGTSKLVTFDRPGLIKIYCNIHPKMVSNILVLENPFFSKTGHDGSFEINDIPDGRFVLRTWYEFGDGFSEIINFRGGKEITTALEIKTTKKLIKHKNKFGKPYRNKY